MPGPALLASPRKLALALIALPVIAAVPAEAATARGSGAVRGSETAPDLPRGPLRPAGRWIKDATGRVVIIHGLQLARKSPPYHAPYASFTAQDAQNIANWGFDAVRLGWFWKGLEPQRGQIDGGYLAAVVREGKLLADHHILTLLEAHQDGYNETLGGAGFPDWATVSDGTWGPVSGVPGVGVFDLQAARAFDNLYANTNGIADAFARAWTVMVGAFHNNPLMLGYDLFNEPGPGSEFATCANPAGCPAFDAATLQPFEDKLAAAVRSADPRTIAFYEPNIYFDSSVPSWLHAPPAASGPSGFAFHDYCLVTLLSGQPDHESQASGYPGCPAFDAGVFGNALRTATAMGVPPLFDEFGDTQDLAQIQRMTRLADQSLTGWMYWSYKDWVDNPGGQGSGPLFDNSDDNGTLRAAKLAAVSQPYPVATAGTPLLDRYDAATGAFTYVYAVDHSVAAPTVIFAAPLHFPNGYRVSVRGARVVSAPGARYLEVRANPGAVVVRVRVSPVAGAQSPSTPIGPVVAAPSTAAPAAPAGSLGTTSGSCNENRGHPKLVSSPIFATAHGDVIARVQTDTGTGEITPANDMSVAFGAGDSAWLDLGVVSAGSSAQATVICRSGPASYNVAFTDAPVPPASFSGSSTHDINVSLASSRLAFQVPANGHYIADVVVNHGTVEVGLHTSQGSATPAATFTAPGSEDLGMLAPGSASLDVTALGSSQAAWTITVRPTGSGGLSAFG